MSAGFLPYFALTYLLSWGIWIPLALTGISNQWLTLAVNTPNDALYAFGPGLYGIAFAFLPSPMPSAKPSTEWDIQ